MFARIKNKVSQTVQYVTSKFSRKRLAIPPLDQPMPNEQIPPQESTEVAHEILAFNHDVEVLQELQPNSLSTELASLIHRANDQEKLITARLQAIDKKQAPSTSTLQYNVTVGEVYEKLQPIQRMFYYPIAIQDFSRLLTVFKESDLNRSVVNHPHLQVVLNVKSFKTLRHGCWLNDEVVNGYIGLLNQRNSSSNTLILKSFIYNLLAGQDDPKIMRISKKQNITSSIKYILMPINPRNTHWTMVLIDRSLKRILYFDSLGGLDQVVGAEVNVMASVWDQMAPLTQDLGKNNNATQYTFSRGSSPRQHNSFDCGVFMLKNIQLISYSHEIDPQNYYGQEMIFYDRLQIGVSLLRGKIG